MKEYRLGLLAVLWCGAFSACIADTRLIVEVSNFESEHGAAVIAVHDSEENWLQESIVEPQSLRVAERIRDGVVSAEFRLPPGEYAVSVYHDANDNGGMDTNFIGIPKEPTGLSNGARARFGPPKYEDARFDLGDAEMRLRIQLN